MGNKVYEIVTEKILAALDKGIVPWRKPWNSLGKASNLITRKPYRGINALVLNCLPYSSSPWYLTFKQVDSLGGSVKKGTKGIPVVFWNFIKNEEEEKVIPFLRYYTVFSVEDCTGLEKRIPVTETVVFSPIEEAERIVAEMPNRPEIVNVFGNKAFYQPSRDKITMPKPEQFPKTEEYYSTLFHEMAHSTGHESRLKRFNPDTEISPFGSADYSREELVAEITAAFLCQESGIDNTMENSVAYIQSWKKALAGDTKAVVIAAGKAQKASDYILNTTQTEE